MKNKLLHLAKTGEGALLLLLLLLMGAAQAKAQETYGLRIAGVDVTSDNCDDLSVIDGVSGTVKYDATTKTLSLDNATITTKGDVEGISNSSIKRLVINVTGENSVIADDYPAIVSFKSVTIQGGGTLNAQSEYKAAITTEAGSLTIDNCTVNAKGAYGMRGNTGEEALTIKNDAQITAEGNNGAVVFFSALTLDSTIMITKPCGAVYEKSLKGIVTNGEWASQVVIGKSQTYGLQIAGVNVTSKNCQDLSGIPAVNGTVRYNPDTKTLTLDNATIKVEGGREAITNTSESDLVIKVTGENQLYANMSAIASAQSMTIQGDGTLNVESSDHSGIAVTNGSLTINHCAVNAKGTYGISGGEGEGTLTIRNGSTVTAQGSNGSIINFDSLTPEDSIAITKPSHAVFDKSLRAVAVNGAVTTEKVTIEELIFYYVQINGERVTNANCSDLSVIKDVSGAVVFDPNTFTLYLKNAVINTTNRSTAIRYDLNKKFTICLMGENHIVTYGAPIGVEKAPTVVTGGGSLDILSGKSIYGDSLTFDDCTINIKTYRPYAFNGTDLIDVRSVLTFRNADVTALCLDTIDVYGVINYTGTLVLDGSEIVEPEGVVFDKSKHTITLNGKPVVGRIVIRRTAKKYGLKIAGTEVTSNNCNDLSVIEGVTGTAKYDPEKKTLFLQDATITATGDEKGIVNDSIDGLTINVTGENTISAKHSGMYLNFNPTVIKGYGSLNVAAVNGVGIYLRKSLEIDNCTATIQGNWGIMGYDAENVTINNASVTAKGTESPFCYINSLTLVNCTITSPKGASFSDTEQAITLNGKVVTSDVVFSPDTTKHYDVVLEECPTDKEAAVSLVQELTGLGQAESEALVESAPCVILSDVEPSKARAICNAFAKLNCPANNYLHNTWSLGVQSAKASDVPTRKRGVYSLDGVYLGSDIDTLPKGIYIKDGKKILK